MRKKIIYFLIGIISISCSQKESKISIVKGDIKGIEKGTATISSADENHILLDSVEIENGRFTLQISVEVPMRYYVFVKNNDEEAMAYMSNIFLGGGEEVKMSAKMGVDRFPTISNAPLQEESKEYEEFINIQEEGKELLRLRTEITNTFKDGDKIKVNELKKTQNALSINLIKKILKFKDDSKTSPVATYEVFNYAATLSLDDKTKIVEMFPANTNNLFYINKLKTDIEAEKNVALGSVASNFNVKDLDGEEYTLDSFKGKYVFLEFSASWCGWCKLEIPHIREAFNKLKEKNIVFITMNMDVTKELWKGTVTNENIEWLCLSNLEGMNSDLAQSYNIHGIPMSYVIDPQGNIIRQDVRGNEILEYLSSLP